MDENKLASGRPGEDERRGTGMGAAANHEAQGGAKAADAARSGGGADVGGTAPPEGVPFAPETPDLFGDTLAETEAVYQEEGIPEEPTPGMIREPGPEAQS